MEVLEIFDIGDEFFTLEILSVREIVQIVRIAETLHKLRWRSVTRSNYNSARRDSYLELDLESRESGVEVGIAMRTRSIRVAGRHCRISRVGTLRLQLGEIRTKGWMRRCEANGAARVRLWKLERRSMAALTQLTVNRPGQP